MREVEKAGKRLPTIDELCEAEIKNIEYVGSHYTIGTFDGRGSSTRLWSSSVSGTSAWCRPLNSGSVGVNRYPGSQASGFSVRLIKL